ncbi:MAG: glycosyltransferase [Muribaculaceae bacterium]|nr:glycosyltransferase [Muribaculaceae bacterium]
MDTRKPLISIITPTLNDGAALRRTIESVDSQSWRPIEHIIVDGSGSISQLSGEHDGIYRQTIHSAARGVYDAINRGIANCSGDIIGILNGNDRLASPHVISDIASAFMNNPEADYTYGHVYFSNAEGKTVRRYRTDNYDINNLKHGFAPPHPSLYMRRQALMFAGPYNCDYITAADFDMFVRIFSNRNLQGMMLDIDFAEMSTGGMSGSWRSRLWTNPRERIKSLRSHGYDVSAVSLIPRYIRLFKEYFK